MIYFITVITVVILLAYCLRVSTLIYKRRYTKTDPPTAKRTKPVNTIIVIGSGGHTSEMLRVVSKLHPERYVRNYILASTDKNSEKKVIALEGKMNTKYYLWKIPRSREVKQSYLTSILSTLYAIAKTFPLVWKLRPDLVLCNGPGTCIPVCGVSFLLNSLFLGRTKIIFIESICRVKSLSLSGKILCYLADEVLVQWEELHKLHPRTKFIGRL